MPIFRQTYNHYDGEYLPVSFTWSVIAQKNIQLCWRNKWFKFFRFPVLGVFLLFTAWIYFATNLDLLSMLDVNLSQFENRFAVDYEFYLRFIEAQTYLNIFISIVLCPLFISNDLKFKAIGLYLSKALTRFDYLFGKGMSLFFYLFINLIFMPFLLVFIYANFSDNIGYLFDFQLLMRIILFGGMIAVSMVMITLAVSSMSHSSATVNVVQVCIFFMLPFFADIVGSQVSGITFFASENSLMYSISYYEWWSLLAPTTVWTHLGQVIFQQETTYQNIHWSIYVLDLIVMCMLCAWFLHIRIKPVEVVK